MKQFYGAAVRHASVFRVLFVLAITVALALTGMADDGLDP